MGQCLGIRASRIRPSGLLLALLIAAPASAGTLVGNVVKVVDGDTIHVLDAGRRTYKVRLGGIDAPERGQAFGKASTKHLASLVAGRLVKVEFNTRDRYGRLVGNVFVDGIDVGLAQVRAGYAWWYRYYQGEQSPTERESYAEAEQQARSQGIGLWQRKRPIPLWEYRRRAW